MQIGKLSSEKKLKNPGFRYEPGPHLEIWAPSRTPRGERWGLEAAPRALRCCPARERPAALHLPCVRRDSLLNAEKLGSVLWAQEENIDGLSIRHTQVSASPLPHLLLSLLGPFCRNRLRKGNNSPSTFH